MTPSITLAFRNLFTYRTNGPSRPGHRLGIEQLVLTKGSPLAATHIHGELIILVHGRGVPYLEETCFGEWIVYLLQLQKALKECSNARYICEGGDEGLPAYLFERADSEIFLSLIKSQVFPSEDEPDWQRIPFRDSDLQSAIDFFIASFRSHLWKANPEVAPLWWQTRIAERLGC